MSEVLERILCAYPEENFTIANGLNEAIIGVDELSMRLIYSIEKCIDILIDSGMAADEAEEYFDYNVAGSYVGEKTPIWSFP